MAIFVGGVSSLSLWVAMFSQVEPANASDIHIFILISVDRHHPVIFSHDWSFIVIFATFNVIGGYLSNASFMLGPKMVNLKNLILGGLGGNLLWL